MAIKIYGNEIVFPDDSKQTTAFTGDVNKDVYTKEQIDEQQEAQDVEIAKKVNDAPEDSKTYARNNKTWVNISDSSGIPDAPVDGVMYGRKDGEWDTVADAGDIYTKTETNDLLDEKADKSTTYTKTEVDNSQNAQDVKIDKNAEDIANLPTPVDAYTKAESDAIDNAQDVEIAKKANTADTYTKTQTDTLLDSKANVGDSYTKAETYNNTEIDSKLFEKADKTTTYTKTEVDASQDAQDVNISGNTSAIGTLSGRVSANEADIATLQDGIFFSSSYSADYPDTVNRDPQAGNMYMQQRNSFTYSYADADQVIISKTDEQGNVRQFTAVKPDDTIVLNQVESPNYGRYKVITVDDVGDHVSLVVEFQIGEGTLLEGDTVALQAFPASAGGDSVWEVTGGGNAKYDGAVISTQYFKSADDGLQIRDGSVTVTRDNNDLVLNSTSGSVVSNQDMIANGKAVVTEAPEDGKQYARQDAEWTEVTGGGSTPTAEPLVWEDKKAERALGTVYTNNNDVPLYLYVELTLGGFEGRYVNLFVDGKNFGANGTGTTTTTYYNSGLILIPSGSTYELRASAVDGIVMDNWKEARMPLAIGVPSVDTAIGMVAPFAMDSVPTGWLHCDGSAVSRTTYSLLYSKVGDTYGAGDGSTTFNLPNLQDDFIRGSSDTLAVGNRQSDAFKSHNHAQQMMTGSGGNTAVLQTVNLNPATEDTGNQTASTGGSETRPRNVAMLYCINATAESSSGGGEAQAPVVFRAKQTNSQPIPDGVETKILFDTTEFDSDSYFDTSNNRYTPKKEGYYQFNSNIQLGGTATGQVFMGNIKKNGSPVAVGSNGFSTVNTIGGSSGASCNVYMNGTTDYVEVFAFQKSGAEIGIQTVGFFDGHLIAGQSTGGSGGGGYTPEDMVWENVTADRSTGGLYTNNNDVPLNVIVGLHHPSPTSQSVIKIDDVIFGYIGMQAGDASTIFPTTTSFTVPSGSTYAVNDIAGVNSTIQVWHEAKMPVAVGTGGGGTPSSFARIVDEKPQGSAGGNSVVGIQPRKLNKIVSDDDGIVTLSEDLNFTLQAGTYVIDYSAPVFQSNYTKIYLHSVTDNAMADEGTSGYDGSDISSGRYGGQYIVTLTEPHTYQVQQYIQNTADDGLGLPCASGKGIFTTVDIEKVGSGGGSGDSIWTEEDGNAQYKYNGGQEVGVNIFNEKKGYGARYSVDTTMADGSKTNMGYIGINAVSGYDDANSSNSTMKFAVQNQGNVSEAMFIASNGEVNFSNGTGFSKYRFNGSTDPYLEAGTIGGVFINSDPSKLDAYPLVTNKDTADKAYHVVFKNINGMCGKIYTQGTSCGLEGISTSASDVYLADDHTGRTLKEELAIKDKLIEKLSARLDELEKKVK